MVALTIFDNRIGLDTRTATLEWCYLTEGAYVFALIAHAMDRFKVVFGVRPLVLTLARKRLDVIENKTSRIILGCYGVNVFFADVAPMAIALKNTGITDLAHCYALQKGIPTPHVFSDPQPIAKLFVLCAAIGAVSFLVSLVVGAVVFSLTNQNLLWIFFSTVLVISLAAFLAFRVVAIPFGWIFPKLAQWLFGTTGVAPFMSRLSNRLVASLAWGFSTLILTINTILTGCSVASLRNWISIKGIHKLLRTTLLANDRLERFSFRGILNVSLALLSALLVPTYFTPRLIPISFWRFFVKLFKGLFNVATCAFPRREQRELTMIYCAHSYGLLLGSGLDAPGVTSTLRIEKLSSIIPQNRSASYSMPLCSRMAVL